MLCPKCKKEMIIIERNKIELDYCILCRGFWLDEAEWDLLIENLNLGNEKKIGDIHSFPKAQSRETIKYCPVCGKAMDKFMLNGVLLDRCPQKHGVWFDNNELSKVLNSQNPTEGATPISFLGEIFYKN